MSKFNANDPIVRKIAKLLQRAEAQAGEQEGETAARIAAKYMATHGIDKEDVNPADVLDADPLGKTDVDAPATTWHRDLASALAFHCGCHVTYAIGGRLITFYGLESDRAVALYLFHLCARQINQKARDWLAANAHKYAKTSRELGRIYRSSAVMGLSEKLQEIQKETQEANPAYGLVLARGPRARDYARQCCGRIYQDKRKPPKHYLPAGRAAGKNLSLRAGVTVADDPLTLMETIDREFPPTTEKANAL